MSNQSAIPSIAIAVTASTMRQLLDELSQWLAPLARATHAVNHTMDAREAPTENVKLAVAGSAAPTEPRMTTVSSHEAGLPRDIAGGDAPNFGRSLLPQAQARRQTP